MKKLSGIYKIENLINGKVYIGSSSDIQQRLKNHKSDLKLNKHGNTHLQYSFNKYGEEVFSFSVIEITDKKDLIFKETYYIKLYKALDRKFGYNKASNIEDTSGYKWSDESRKKLSQSKKGKPIHPNTKKALIEANKKRVYQNMDYLWSKENIEKSAKARQNPILQYTLEGKFVKIWSSASTVEKEIGIKETQISSCCRGTRYKAGNFQWFKKPNNNLFPLVIPIYKRCSKRKNITEFMRLCSEMNIEKQSELLEKPEEVNQQPS
jgi:group I intron endonuclease